MLPEVDLFIRQETSRLLPLSASSPVKPCICQPPGLMEGKRNWVTIEKLHRLLNIILRRNTSKKQTSSHLIDDDVCKDLHKS